MKNSIFLLFAVMLTMLSATADTYTVTQSTDNGTGATSGSLSWAINTAAATGDVIAFNLTTGDVVTLSAALPTIDKSFTMEGINIATGNPVTIQVASPGVSTFRVFFIWFSAAGKTITLNDLILRGGDISGLTSGNDYGGVIRFLGTELSTINLSRCIIRDGKARYGGGINHSLGNLTINQCTLNNNTSTSFGGGIYSSSGAIYTTVILNTAICNNSAALGGGVYNNRPGSCRVINSTISGNSGSGIYGNGTNTGPNGSSYFFLLNSSIVNNTPYDFYRSLTYSFQYRFFVWAASKPASQTWSTELAYAPNTTTAYTAGDLGSLSNNGGPTPTMQLSVTAPAYHTGSYAYYNATDGYYFKGTDNFYYKFVSTGVGCIAFTPTSANPENDKITTDQRVATRENPPSMGSYDGMLSNPMQLVFTTTAASQSIALPLYGTVNCTVDWGDGSATEDFTTTGLKPHTFATAGTYTVSINGSLTHFGYYDDEDDEGWYGAGYLTEVVDFGSLGLTSLSGAFADADNLSSVPAALPATVTDLSYCFYLNGKASITNLNSWDVSHVTNMSAAFYKASAFNQDISSWDVGAVTNMEDMFKRAFAFNQPIGFWDVSSVTNMEDMFRSADAFNQNISSWDVSSVTTMEGMFESASAFNQDIGGWVVGSVTTMSSMFDWATSFNQDISDWDVINVTDMSWMFSGATAFDQSLAGWDISSVTTMEDMFADVTLSTANYDAILISWGSNAVESDVVFGAGNSKYSAGAAATARGVLTSAPNNWTITDGGMNVVTYTWDGSSSSAWNTAANWDLNAVPTATDNVVIANAGIAPVITSSNQITVNQLTVNSGASLTINSGGSLIASSANGTVTVERMLNGLSQYHFLSSPVNNANLATIFDEGYQMEIYLRRFDEPTGNWVNLEIPAYLSNGTGYS
ncbi:MAG: BspA family leucine-rich repeat surface protein, partial [Bacteroidales bacterium]|nr:BspA family leucine-rich repeat surface protein [Bacteroidales bacterium]